jgi:hypothetical protein
VTTVTSYGYLTCTTPQPALRAVVRCSEVPGGARPSKCIFFECLSGCTRMAVGSGLKDTCVTSSHPSGTWVSYGALNQRAQWHSVTTVTSGAGCTPTPVRGLIGRCPVQSSTQLGPAQANVLLLSDFESSFVVSESGSRKSRVPPMNHCLPELTVLLSLVAGYAEAACVGAESPINSQKLGKH